MPTFGSLFAGIGGMDLGLERAGWECRWQVEIDEFCRSVLTKHWPDVTRYGDIREVHDLAPVDLVCGGFPCQPVSKGGKRSGREDARWLWPEYARIVRLLRPRFVVVENSPGLLTVNRGLAFNEVLSDLATLGYDTEWDCLPAKAFGSEHQRDRLFAVAHVNGDGPVRLALQAYPVERGEPTQPAIDASDWWTSEPAVGRVVHGIPSKLDEARVGALGNAVVPQVAEWIGRRLMEVA